MAQLGMDVGEVRALAAQMKAAANEINGLASKLTSQLQNAHWTGPDQQRFLGDWNGTHKRNLSAVAEALIKAAEDANNNANAQEQTSA
jgi:uncharacterized protein YukE